MCRAKEKPYGRKSYTRKYLLNVKGEIIWRTSSVQGNPDLIKLPYKEVEKIRRKYEKEMPEFQVTLVRV